MCGRKCVPLLGLGLVAMLLACAGGAGHMSRGGPEPLFRPDPVFPPDALVAHSGGEVVVLAFVDEVGATRDVRVLAETPTGHGFGEAAKEAMAAWVWSPATMGGVPVDQSVRIAVRFDPDQAGKALALPAVLKRSDCPGPPGLASGTPAAVVFDVAVGPDGFPARIGLVRATPNLAGMAEAARTCLEGWRWIEGKPGRTCIVIRFGADSSLTNVGQGEGKR